MDDSRAKVVGPAIAVGAVSLGLIIIGACGVGQQDVYVPPPPIEAELAVAPAPVADEVTSTTYSIAIPPSPTWRIAPHMSPRKPFSLSSTETEPSEPPAEGEPSENPRPSEATTESHPPETTTVEDQPVTTTRPRITTTPRVTTPSPTRTLPPRLTTPLRIPTPDYDEDEEVTEPVFPPTHAYDHATPTAPETSEQRPAASAGTDRHPAPAPAGPLPADTGATPTPPVTTETTVTQPTPRFEG
ncbi:hypothetical protein [Nocardia sp. SSK8]|uniref:hypothetical protein n=1 Tax=Nocardia sp. SSK8 TaxID=3120154 RepID=UPI00300B259A